MAFKFEGLEIWQLAIEYVDPTYDVVNQLPQEEEFNLKSQLRRAATSIALNIAEGSTGQSNPEQDRFLGYTLRSLLETVACQHLIRRRYQTVDVTQLQDLYVRSQTLARKIQSLRKTLQVEHRRFVRESPTDYTGLDVSLFPIDE